ncbi:MAG TPA: S9 family peptidase, partial [Gemmatimonadaceae bacterium]|nr:S9 family peptidase [Gemmatimonadaceae bacterium]
IDVEAWTTTNDVWLVPVTGGAATKGTTNPAADARPVFTRDGTLMIVMSQRRPGFEADRRYLDVYDRRTGARRTVFETPDLSITNFWLASDDREILFVATADGADNLYRVPLAGGTPVLVERGGSISALSVAANTVVYLRSSMTGPAELWSASLAYVLGGAEQDGPRQLTYENAAWLAEVEIQPPVRKSAAGAGGTPVQYWLLTPPGFDASRKYPVVSLIHGGPQGDWGDAWSYRWNPALWAARGWVVVAPNPRGSTGFGQQFVDEISRDWGGKVMEDLDAVFDAVRSLPYVDAERQGIAGASYGGYAVNWIIGHTTAFKAAVSHDGVFNMESMMLTTDELWFSEWESGGAVTSEAARADSARWSPHRFAGAMKTPTLVITNELDFRVPVDQGLQLFTALRRNGVESRALVFPDEGHWVLKPLNSRRWHEEVFAWMRRYIGP